ncbi:MAG: methyltransferase [Candidatus Kerfeldbacteria bacterium]|nr:methyltransferase [Candidatus Kerfeldbacteria bacterium]
MKYHFWKGLKFDISNPDVYPPKPATLFFAEIARKTVKPGSSVLEMGGGSGAIAIAVARFVKKTTVVASDINPHATKVTQINAKINRAKVTAITSDFFKRMRTRKFDVIIVHPPAIPYPKGKTWGMSRGMTIATNGGPDGSALVVRSIIESVKHLKSNGTLLLGLPHWSNTGKAYQVLFEHFSNIKKLGQKEIRFFPVMEGKPSTTVLRHAKKLAGNGIIELWGKNNKLYSRVSVIEAKKF